MGTPNVAIRHFPDTESYVQIPQIKSLRSKLKNKKVTIYHSLYPEQDKRIFELLLILSLVRKQTKHIELFAPYLPYARQDRASKVGEAVSADVLCKLLKAHGVKKLATYDCHFLYGPGNFIRCGLEIKNLSAGKILYAHAKKYFKNDKFLVISPDESASYFTEQAQGHSLKKARKTSNDTRVGTGIHADVDTMEGEIDVKGKNICIMDDMISTGGTMMHAIKHLKKLGAKDIIVSATHGIFAGDNIAKKILQSGCSHIFITDSIQNAHRKEIQVLKLPTR